MHSGIFKTRQVFVFLFFLLVLSVLLLRLVYLQALNHTFYAKIAEEQHNVKITIPPKRGTIFDRNMRILAVNLNRDSVYADPKMVKDKRYAGRALAKALDLNENFVLNRLYRDKSFVWLKRRVTPVESAQVNKLKIEGVGLVKESKRFYPNSTLACHVLGTVNIDNVGLEGLELYYDKYLKGQPGWLTSSRDARKKVLESYQDEFVGPKDGANLVLTIDEVIQNIAERELYKMYSKYHAKGASIVVMDPKNGDILALANFPAYDLNHVDKRAPDSVRNRAINDYYEPGSVFKIVAASGLLEEKAVRFDDKFDCENGAYTVGRRTLHDHTPHGIMTFREVIEKSSNIGTVKAASRLGKENMYKYIKAFGFCAMTGVDLPGEVTGIVRPVPQWSGVSMLAIPMGQEVTVTALQLASAIAVIADNGYLVRPRIVREVIDENGEVIKENPPKVVWKAISPQTAYKMRYLLKGVVESGTGKKAKMEDFESGGKTGTAQKVEPSGVYSHNKFLASFIGFAPVAKPVIAVAVCVDEPRVVYYGGDVAAPVFKNVVEQSLKYLNAKPAPRPRT